jgi:hypothetical protein
MITTNKTTVTIPWFRVGVPEIKLAETLEAVQLAVRAQQPAKTRKAA